MAVEKEGVNLWILISGENYITGYAALDKYSEVI